MPDFDAYFVINDPIADASRAVDAWNRILADPSSVVLVRESVALSAQTVRIEYDGRQSDVDSDAGHGASLRATLFGVQGHPSVSISDTDIEAGDRLNVGGFIFDVERVINPPGEFQAFCVSV